MKETHSNKKKNNKKRRLPSLSHFTDLPFEHHQHDQPNPNSNNNKEDAARVPSSDQSHATQAANEFRTHGDKLAMDSLVEKSTQGTFISHGRENVLVAALVRSEHADRVRVAETGVGVQAYFRPPLQGSYISAALNEEMIYNLVQEIKQEIKQEVKASITASIREDLMREFDQRLETLGLLQQIPGLAQTVVPLEARVSTKESCATYNPSEDDISFASQCELYLDDIDPIGLVALGKVFEGVTMLHNMHLPFDMVKVTVEKVCVGDAAVPVPTSEISVVAEAYNCFVAWPRHLVRQIKDQSFKCQKQIQAQKRKYLSTDDPIAALLDLAKIIGINPVKVPWDATIFVKDSKIPLYIYMSDILEIASGNQELNISVMHLWEMYMSAICSDESKDEIYGFLDPQMIQDTWNKKAETQSYITNCLLTGEKKIYFVPYIYEHRWQLLVISLPDNTVTWFCSLLKKSSYLKQIVDRAYSGYNIMKGRPSAITKKLKWMPLKCNKQIGGYKRGYYVMQWMSTIVRGGIERAWDQFLNTHSFDSKAVDYIRSNWAKYFLEMYNIVG